VDGRTKTPKRKSYQRSKNVELSGSSAGEGEKTGLTLENQKQVVKKE